MNFKVLLIFFLIYITGHAQNDSLIDITNHSFKSEIESKLITEIDKTTSNCFDLMLVASGIDNQEDINKYKIEFEKIVNYFEKKQISEKPLKNRIKFIFKHMHSEYFKLYNSEVTFKEIFNKGYYNCVTASALFAMLFERFEIPYEIKEQPTHIYLVVDPLGEAITVESTAPENGYNLYNAKYRKQYIDHMVKHGLMTKSESSAYLKTLFPNDLTISKIDLVGVQYYNNGIFSAQKERFDESILELEKALYIYDSQQVRATLFSLMGNSMIKEKLFEYSDVVKMRQMFFIMKDILKTDKLILSVFSKIIIDILEESNNRKDFKKSYKLLFPLLKSKESQVDFEVMYSTELCRNFALSSEFDSSMIYINRAIELKPSNSRVLYMYEYACIEIVREQTDAIQSLQVLDSLTQNQTYLKTREDIQETYFSLYCYAAKLQYGINDLTQGDSYLEKAATLLSVVKWNKAKEILGYAYYEAWRAYSRANKEDDAIKMANKGLTIDPYNEDLNRVIQY